jgi:rare lipoprotein A
MTNPFRSRRLAVAALLAAALGAVALAPALQDPGAGTAAIPATPATLPSPASPEPAAAPAHAQTAARAAAPVYEPAPVYVLETEAEPEVLKVLTGVASYYASSLAGRRTASGERYDPRSLVAAHRQLPFGTRLRVTNPANGRSVEVRVIDRGPFTRGRVLDLSRSAAEELGMIRRGVASVRIEVLSGG